MTEEELKALPPESVEIIPAEQAELPLGEKKSATEQAAEQLKQQLRAAQDSEKAARETAESERHRRLEAERIAQSRTQETAQYRDHAASNEMQAVINMMAAAKAEADAGEREYQQAQEAGDFAKTAQAQRKMARAEAQAFQAEQRKSEIEVRRPVAEGRVEPQPAYQADPVEMFIASASPATQTWLRQNRNMVQVDPRLGPVLDKRVVAAHYAADAEGIPVDTPEYFSFVEGRLRPQPPMAENDTRQSEPQPPRQQQRQAPVAAPVSRDAGGSNGGSSTQRIRLTAEQAELARLTGDPRKTEREREIEYWNNMQALKAEGRLGNTTH